MKCLRPIRLTKNLCPVKYPDGLEVPCGRCLHCRKQYSRQWSVRMYHELAYHDTMSFITLTYDQKNVPVNEETRFMTLKKADLQKFFKRLRKRLDNRRIKYYACGEYGTYTQRPHYHAILYGVGLSDPDRKAIMDSWKLCDWKNETIKKNAFGLVETKSIQYVTSYIDKKLSGPLAEEEYVQKGREPVFRLVSNGIGRSYILENQKQLSQDGFIRIGGSKTSLPRYYLNTLEKEFNKKRAESPGASPLARLAVSPAPQADPTGSEALKLKIQQAAYFSECEQIEKLTGINTTFDAYYKTQSSDNVIKLVKAIKSKRIQHDMILTAKVNLFRSKKC